jgi:putative serine protease PepD
LVDEQGRLIGINVAIASAGSGAQAGNIGVGFAIPSNVAQRIATEIMGTGKASHALLGAGVTDSTGNDDNSGFSVGAEIKELTRGGAAEKAGLAVGDVVVKFNGQAITTAGELTAAVRQEPAGAKAVVEVVRNNKTVVVNVVLGDAADLK